MFNVLPFCILLLTVRVIPCAALPSLNIRETLSSFTSIRRSGLPRSNPPILAATGVNYNPNGSAFLWLPLDDYSGPNFFEWVYVERWCIFHWFSDIPYSAAGLFSVKQIQRSTLEMPPLLPYFRLRLTVVVFQFQWKCQVSLSITFKTLHFSHHEWL